jgi:hypothetical protein
MAYTGDDQRWPEQTHEEWHSMNRIVVKLSRKDGFVKRVKATLAWEVESVEHLG